MTIFLLPDLGEGLPEAEILEWYVKEGDEVEIDQPLVSVETAKAVVDIPSPQKGKIKKCFAREGEVVKTESALLEFEGEEVSASVSVAVGDIEIGKGTIEKESIEKLHAKFSAPKKVKALPAARVLAKKRGIDLSLVSPSGVNDTITVEDIEQFYAHHTFKAQSSQNVEALRGVRRAMVYSMTKSRDEVVPITVQDVADVHHFSKDTDITLRIIRAIVYACKVEPALNVYFESSRLERILFQNINLIVAMDSEHGLFTPVLNDVGNRADEDIRRELNVFKQKVKNRSLSPQEMQGGTFTLSNFGMYAGRYATPVVIPPTVAILGVGRICEDVVAVDGKPAVHRMIPLSLTVDHRVITGAETIRFLAAAIESLQE